MKKKKKATSTKYFTFFTDIYMHETSYALQPPYFLKLFYHLFISLYVLFCLFNLIFSVDNIHKKPKKHYFFQVKESATVTVPFNVFYAEKQSFVSDYHVHARALNWWTIAQSLKPCGKTIMCVHVAVSLLLSSSY